MTTGRPAAEFEYRADFAVTPHRKRKGRPPGPAKM